MLASRWVGPIHFLWPRRVSLEPLVSCHSCLSLPQVWRGALLLADYILFQRDVFQGRTVLELGAGTGLASIIAATVARTVYCTGRPTISGACPDCVRKRELRLLLILPSHSAGFLHSLLFSQ